MEEISIVPVAPKHYQDILTLNKELVHFLAEMDQQTMLDIGGVCELFVAIEVDGAFAGFLMAMREGKAYDGINYKWFENAYPHFLYIDRVVLSPKFHKMGLGSKLYAYVFDYAKETHAAYVTAEIDIAPPNPVSLAFHKAKGFTEVGTLDLPYGNKRVSLQVAAI